MKSSGIAGFTHTALKFLCDRNELSQVVHSHGANVGNIIRVSR